MSTRRWPLILVLAILGGPAGAQAPPLAERQSEINERYQRLETRMLELARILRDKEPEKAERLTDGLAISGREQIKSRLGELRSLLVEARFGAAGERQEQVLGDLEALLDFLVNPTDELDRLRKEREALERLQRNVRELFDDQARQLYETRQHNEQTPPREPTPPGDAPGAAAQADEQHAARVRQLEDRQRQLQERARQLRQEMSPADPSRGTPATPGQEPFERAGQQMQRAADRLGEQSPQQAQPEQEQALEALQETLDELERALRQTREEERAEALLQLENRLRAILADEHSVRDGLVQLAAAPADERNRGWDLRRAELLELHRGARDQTASTHAIMVGEGTTVVAPALLELARADMDIALAELEAARVDARAQHAVDDAIALLEELLAAIAQERDRQAEGQPGQPGQQGGSDAAPLLPRSAELKLLRSQQVRINEQTVDVAAEGRGGADRLTRLAERQDWLSRRARQINEALE